MARFYASISGDDSTERTRQGHRIITGHIRGWRCGVRVTGCFEPGASEENQDAFNVYITTGSKGKPKEDVLIGTVIAGEFYPAK